MGSLQWNKAFALEQTAGDEELLDELIIIFKDSSAADYEQLKEAVAAQDAEGIITAAHSLKGASASLGIEAIQELALDMESSAREGNLSGMEEKSAAMAALIDELSKI